LQAASGFPASFPAEKHKFIKSAMYPAISDSFLHDTKLVGYYYYYYYLCAILLKYKYIFEIKYMEAILPSSTGKLLWFEITKMRC